MDYLSLRLDAIKPDQLLGTNLYIHVAGRFLLYSRSEDTLDFERWRKLSNKGVKALFVRNEEIALLWQKIASDIVAPEKGHVALAAANSIALQTMFDNPRKKENYLLVDKTGKAVNSKVEKTPAALKLLMDLESEPDIFQHSLNVAALSIDLAYILEAPTKTIDIIATGALLHDIGKSRVSKKDDHEEMLQHPRLGADLLYRQNYIPKEVLDVILLHEETTDGKGYPGGIKDIEPIFQIVGITNRFENYSRIFKQDYKKAFIELAGKDKEKYSEDIINGLEVLLRNRKIIKL